MRPGGGARKDFLRTSHLELRSKIGKENSRQADGQDGVLKGGDGMCGR